MAKFCDPKIWDEDWFCEMSGEYQHFLRYVFDKCDNAGVWKPNKFDFETKTKFKVSLDQLFKAINGGGQQRVLLLDNGRWFFTGYILFQWFNKKKTFDLVLSNRLHKSLYDIVIENKISPKKIRGLREVLKTSRVMVMDNDSINVIKEKEDEKIFAKGIFLTDLPKDIRLTDMQTGATVEYIRLQTKKTLTDVDIGEEWEAFKIDNFDKKQHYQSFEDVLSHFRRTLKKRVTDGKTVNSAKSNGLGNKSGGVAILTEALRAGSGY